MGGFAARKALQVVKNVEHVLAIELFAACQALSFHRPLKTTKVLELVYESIREQVPFIEHDQFMSPHIEACAEFLQTNKLCKVVSECLMAEETSPESVELISQLFPID